MNRGSVSVRRFAMLVVAAASVSLAGCEGAQQVADQPAMEKLAQAQEALAEHHLDAALSAGDAAANTPGISPDLAYEAHSLQGRVHMARAAEYLQKAEDTELNLSRLIADLRVATAQIKAAQAQIQSDQGYDPAKAKEQLDAKIAEARGGDGQLTWSTGGENSLPTMLALDQQINKLKAAIADNQKQSQAAAAQRTALLEKADQFQQKSLGEPGAQSVEDVKAAADARKQAAGVAVDMDKLAAALAPLQADLRTMQTQRAGTDAAIGEYKDQANELDLAWQGVQQDINLQKKALTVFAGPAPATTAAPAATSNNLPPPVPQPTTIADQAAQLKTLVTQWTDLRGKAADELNTAVRVFNAAATAGDTFRRDEVGQRIQSDRIPPTEKFSWQQLQESYAGGSARLAAAEAERELAVNYAAQAILSAELKKSLAAVQTTLGSDAPAAVAECLAVTPSSTELASSSEEQFQKALEDFDNQTTQTLPGPGSQVRRTAAEAGKMITAFGAKQLSLALANKPIAGQTPKDLQTMIDTLANAVNSDDPAMLPSIPYTLTPPGQTPTP